MTDGFTNGTGGAAQVFALKRAGEFLPIVSEDRDGARVVYYGGDQAWYRTRVGRYSGCGAVAAADIFAYLAIHHPDMKALFRSDSSDISVERFLEHMEEAIKYVPPKSIEFLDIPYGGLTSLERFTQYAEAYALKKGMELKGHYFSADDLDYGRAVERIGAQLSGDNPVALLTMQNAKLRRVPYTDPQGKPGVTDLRYHWMVITELKTAGEKAEITVSSEGARVGVDFNDVWTADAGSPMAWRGIVYFSKP